MNLADVACVDPQNIFQGPVIVLAPHMDDEILACGGTIAALPKKDHIHVVYATDGSQSPVPMFPWIGPISNDLSAIRVREARQAMAFLNIPDDNVTFLGLPDGQLKRHLNGLAQLLADVFIAIEPAWVMIPFRYDRHPDHIALNQASRRAISRLKQTRINIAEYFVYYRWRLLPGTDIRNIIRSDQLIKVDITGYSNIKKKALESYESQTTLFFPWQTRPILPHHRVNEVSRSHEYFLKYNFDYPGANIFQQLKTLIRIIHLVEPTLKILKDKAIELLRRGLAFPFSN